MVELAEERPRVPAKVLTDQQHTPIDRLQRLHSMKVQSKGFGEYGGAARITTKLSLDKPPYIIRRSNRHQTAIVILSLLISPWVVLV
jgi:hypothetical protein